ncbi:TetR/AcrR family transcriptional regulator [Rhodococcus sp. ACT016]|uniref:TetR/AcrR family transcriptional regulator n=1 Tax=Rhodococcus sp. ACT016 TaxID=3134808 RepID=UPI003D2C58BB
MSSSTNTSTTTRERILLAAERLFSERGLNAVSLREVGTAAGQRNSAAVQYHFGDKEALLAAIFEHRMHAINENRLQLLAAIQADGRSADLRSLLEAFVFPLAAQTSDPDSHYGGFLVQLLSDPTRRSGFDWESATSLRIVWASIQRSLGALPPQTVEERMTMLHHVVVRTVADHDGTANADAPNHPGWAVRLVDAALGLLTAPTSEHVGN